MALNGDLYWTARNIDTGTCPVCGDSINRGTPVKFYRDTDAWPNVVRHADRTCYEIEAMQEMSYDQEPVLVP